MSDEAAATIRDLQARLEQAEREKAAMFDHKEAENQLLERQASDLRALLREAGEVVDALTIDRHTFAPMRAPDGDTCAICQNDVRHPVHFRSGESVMGDVRRARAFLDKLKENADSIEGEGNG